MERTPGKAAARGPGGQAGGPELATWRLAVQVVPHLHVDKQEE